MSKESEVVHTHTMSHTCDADVADKPKGAEDMTHTNEVEISHTHTDGDKTHHHAAPELGTPDPKSKTDKKSGLWWGDRED
jgi:hypothetical protein